MGTLDYTIRWHERTPVLTLTIEGEFDIGRTLAQLSTGRVELGRFADRIATELRHAHRGRGLPTLAVLEGHGGPRLGVVLCAECDGEITFDVDEWAWTHVGPSDCTAPDPADDELPLSGDYDWATPPWWVHR